MTCHQCGESVSASAKFCTRCGAPLEKSHAGSAPASPSPPPFPADSRSGGTGPVSADDWDAFFRSLGSDELQVTRPSAGRYEFSGERKVKALLSRTTLRYAAVAALDEGARRLRWWEKLSESSFGLTPQNAGISGETRRQKGMSVTVEKSVRTPGGAYTYRYGDLRAVVEAEARERGWEVQTVLVKP